MRPTPELPLLSSHSQPTIQTPRSKDEFIQYYNGFMRGPFAAFCARRGWEQKRDRKEDAAAFATIPHHPSYVAPGDRQHHMRQVQVRMCVCEGTTDSGVILYLGFFPLFTCTD